MDKIINILDSKNYFNLHLENDFAPFVLVIPGGGYEHTSDREALNVADRFKNLGFNYAVLKYCEEFKKYPQPQKDVAYTINYLKNNYAKFIDFSKLVIIGFSAGAHLALSYTIYHQEYDGIKPSYLVLSYPVVSSDFDSIHIGSFKNLLQDDYELLIDKMSLEKHIPSNMPDTFLWHTVTDQSVPVSNSIKLMNALLQKNNNVEAHFFPEGPHGLALADKTSIGGWITKEYPHEATWFTMLENWMRFKKII